MRYDPVKTSENYAPIERWMGVVVLLSPVYEYFICAFELMCVLARFLDGGAIRRGWKEGCSLMSKNDQSADVSMNESTKGGRTIVFISQLVNDFHRAVNCTCQGPHFSETLRSSLSPT